MSSSALLLLSDGRFPGGGYAHSAGLESQAALGLVDSVEDLREFLLGRLHTTGLVDAAIAAWVTDHVTTDLCWEQIDAEVSARVLTPALRRVSRARGRQMARAIDRVWPGAIPVALIEVGDAPHISVVTGLAAAAAGLSAGEAALCAAYDSVTISANAAVRLLGLDPFAVQRILTELAPDIDATAISAAGHSSGAAQDLPALSAPLSDIHAELHAHWEVRLFAS